MHPNYSILLAGALSALALPPVFIFPCWIVGISILLHNISISTNAKSAFIVGWLWGFAYFVFGLYWIANGPATYFKEFWWAIPLSLFGIPFVMAFLVAIIACLAWYFREKPLSGFYFSIIWVFFEWVREWIFTGFPWNSANYVLHFSDILMQMSYIWGPYGQIFAVIFFSASVYDFYKKRNHFTLAISSCVLVLMAMYGYISLKEETKFSNIYARLVQPNTIQGQKWDYDSFLGELDTLVELSNLPSDHEIDLVIWPESAVILPPEYPLVMDTIKNAVHGSSVLLTGGEMKHAGKFYTSIYAVDNNQRIISYANKHHLVPFGEYIPSILKKIFPFVKKLTPGLEDFTPGEKGDIIKILGLKILPLICYEALFPSDVRLSSNSIFPKVDLFVHITNDSYYGNTSGPYQHFEQSRARAVENNTPILRVGSNGISAFIDNKGRVIKRTFLNDLGIIDGFVPKLENDASIYGRYNHTVPVIFFVSLWLLLLFLVKRLKKS